MVKTSIVVGYGYGDEGKGNTVSWLSREPNSLVVRFNGGQQAGHAVFKGKVWHEFSSIGSGAMNGAQSYISHFCTIFPTSFNIEYDSLVSIGYRPIVIIDPMTMITTPFDIESNWESETNDKHGSCGAGFGKTVFRHETLDHSYRIFAMDLDCRWILEQKLLNLCKYYNGNPEIIRPFIESCDRFLSNVHIDTPNWESYDHIIFEGAQGILLDRQHGIFPHVTRSNTTSKNAIEICQRNNLPKPDIFGILRCYSTRHGNGPLKNECSKDDLGIVDPFETNVTNDWQGRFRYAPFSFDLQHYSDMVDRQYYGNYFNSHKLVITCFDHVEEIRVNNYHTMSKEKFKLLFEYESPIFVESNDFSKYETHH